MKQLIILITIVFLSSCAVNKKLISVEDNIRVDTWQKSGNGWSIKKTTLHGGMQEGVDIIEVNNGALSFRVVPSRGMSLQDLTCGDVTLGWNSPVKQIVNPKFIDLQDLGGLGWLDGFNEAMTRCGVSFSGHPGEDDGRLLTLHGRIGNIPASEVVVSVDEKAPYRIRIRGLVEERRFKFGIFQLWTELSTVPGSKTIRFEDRLVNLSEYPQEYEIIYHGNFGQPLLEKDAKVTFAAKEVFPFDDNAAKHMSNWDTYLGPTKGYGEQVFCVTPYADSKGQTTMMLQNAKGNRGVALHYDVNALPVFNLWKNTDTLTDGYVTGLEPATNYAYTRATERKFGRVKKLAAGAEVTFKLEYEILSNKKAVQKTAIAIKKIQAGRKTKMITKTPEIPEAK
jgi:hypothetical protein